MGLFSSSNKTTQETKAYGPAKGVMDSALGFMGSQPYMEAYGGPYAAAMNPMLAQSLSGMYNAGQGMFNQMYQPGMDMMLGGMQGYQGQLNALQNRGPNQFRFDQGLYNQMMDNAMPGLRSAVDAQGRMSSMGLQSNLGQLVSGSAGAGFGSNPLSKLGQGSAALISQNRLNDQTFAANLYNQANAQAAQAGMGAGMANMNALNANDARVLGGYGNMANMGRGALGVGLQGLNMGLNAGQLQQNFDQFGIDMARQQFMDKQTIPMQDAMARAQMSGQLGQMFGKTTTRTKSSPSMMSGLGQLGSFGMNMLGGFGMMGMGPMAGIMGQLGGAEALGGLGGLGSLFGGGMGGGI